MTWPTTSPVGPGSRATSDRPGTYSGESRIRSTSAWTLSSGAKASRTTSRTASASWGRSGSMTTDGAGGLTRRLSRTRLSVSLNLLALGGPTPEARVSLPPPCHTHRGADMSTSRTDRATIPTQRLKERVKGRVIGPDDADYDAV